MEEARKKAEEESEAKRAQEAKERQAYTAIAVMTVQAKIAAFQAASALLTADLQAGKITSAEYGERMTALSAMLQ
jgi:hypothetical protein